MSNNKPKYNLRTLPATRAKDLEGLPSFGPRGNITGMRKNHGWENAMPVKCGNYVYNCESRPELYEEAREGK